jgi:hypothetical protein
MSSRARRGRRFRSPVPAQQAQRQVPDSPTESSQHQSQLIESSEATMSAPAAAGSNGMAVRPSSAGPDLVARINAGEFDEDLYLLSKTVRARWDAVEAAKTLHAMASIQLGDWVRLKDEMKTKRLRGLIGQVVERPRTRSSSASASISLPTTATSDAPRSLSTSSLAYLNRYEPRTCWR